MRHSFIALYFNRITTLSVATLAFSLSFSTATWADILDVKLPISAVKVHPASAIVTREKTVSLPAGEHQLRITGLPGNLDPARLQLAIPNNNVRMGSLEVERQHAGDLTTDKEQQLQAELNGLQDSRNSVSDKIETAKTELELLGSLAKGGSDASVKPSVNGAELANLISTISKSSAQARERIRSAEIELRDWDKKIAQKKYELEQVKTSRVTTSTVTVNLRMASAIQTTAALTYPEYNAGWSWLYEARLDTDAKKLGLLRQAVVQQASGEDWNNIALTLTTADQREGAVTPQVNSLYVDIFTPKPAARYKTESDRAVMSAAPELGNVMQEVTVTASFQRDTADVVASQYLVDYSIPGKTTIKANRQQKVVPIDEKQFDVELIARTVPSKDLRAFLEATFTYKGDIPLQAGKLQLYRDNAFIGDHYASAFLPNADIRLPFGADERIRVEVRNEAEETREGGLIRRDNVQEHKVRYELTSFHAQPVPVEVLDQLPVSKNAKINVDILDGATPAAEKDVEGKEGLLLWKLTLKPQEKTNVRHYYSISYPKDAELDYFER